MKEFNHATHFNFNTGCIIDSWNGEPWNHISYIMPNEFKEKVMYMHISTFSYLKEEIDKRQKYRPNKIPHNIGFDFTVFGHRIEINNNLSETIDEGKNWIFPNEPLVKYEESDESWCRYFGIGRPGKGIVWGEIIIMGSEPYFNKKIFDYMGINNEE